METILIVIFVVGYAAITLEHNLKINKTAPAVLTGVLMWSIISIFSHDTHLLNEELLGHLGDISSILFFLLGAMTIVELIDAHDGFELVTDKLRQTNKRKLLWMISFLAFFMSAVLDNLTSTIVIVSLLRKLIADKEDRLTFIGMVVVAANAGGAWTPIGDITTTMLWVGGQVSTDVIITRLFAPSVVALIVPLLVVSWKMKGDVTRPEILSENHRTFIPSYKQKRNMLVLGVASLIAVPIFKYFTHLPPFMGVMLGLAVIWFYTTYLHRNTDEEHMVHVSLISALKRVDMASILFFLGILLAVSSLEVTGMLHEAAAFLNDKVGNLSIISLAIGVLSAIVDNVPLVAAAQGMYSLDVYPMNHYLWEFMAYCAGTGGSILIIGSAAGVAAMGMENISFFWYVKKISWPAFLGYLAGAAAFMVGFILFYHGAA